MSEQWCGCARCRPAAPNASASVPDLCARLRAVDYTAPHDELCRNAADELDRLARELAEAELDVQRAREVRNSEADARIAAEAELARAREERDAQNRWRQQLAGVAEAAEAELARARAALREIASCRTRPPADAIEIACRYWADAPNRS